ncbi:disease resistance protein Pik-2-like [Oryza brachyantha]|uniref:disease resistance protein Pik-2-like n=1 Tax=Oryza brachyantha TaxID=4533 RepID=UPI001ADAE9C4|nr:disease resistance protein Pik-2-like [Oryza brachyantha]
MAELAIGISRTAIEALVNKFNSAIKEEEDQWQAMRRDLVFITDEFEMMQSFLSSADGELVKTSVVRTWVRQVRDLSYDFEDCIEFILHLDTDNSKRSWWLRLLPSWSWQLLMCSKEGATRPVDEAVTQIQQLMARVKDVSERKIRYRFIGDVPGSLTQQQMVLSGSAIGAPGFDILAEARDTAARRTGAVDLIKLITEKSGDDHLLRVISLWATGDDLGTVSIIRNMYDDPRIKDSFRCRAWVKVTHPINPHELVRSLVVQFYANYSCQEPLGRDALSWLLLKYKRQRDALSWTETSAGDLVKEFLRQVETHRYLIILEDLSSVVQWDAIRPYLRGSNNRSRVVVSTRNHEIASLCTGKPYRVSELQRISLNQSICVFFNSGIVPAKGSTTIPTQESIDRRCLGKNSLVGRDLEGEKLFKLIKDRPHTEKPHVVSVWGIPGSGRTALVSDVYDRCCYNKLFDRQATVSIPQPYNLMGFCRCLLLSGLASSVQPQNPIRQCCEVLHADRCLVVIDEVQSKEDWDSIKDAGFISAKCKSCFVVITTEESVATHCAGADDLVCSIRCLPSKAAFDLFLQAYQEHNRNSFEEQEFQSNKDSFEEQAFSYIFGGVEQDKQAFQNDGNSFEGQSVRNNGNSFEEHAYQEHNRNSFEEQEFQSNKDSFEEQAFRYIFGGVEQEKQAFQNDGNSFEGQSVRNNGNSFEEHAFRNMPKSFEEEAVQNNGNSIEEQIFENKGKSIEDQAFQNKGSSTEEKELQNSENLLEEQALLNNRILLEEPVFQNNRKLFVGQAFPNNGNSIEQTVVGWVFEMNKQEEHEFENDGSSLEEYSFRNSRSSSREHVFQDQDGVNLFEELAVFPERSLLGELEFQNNNSLFVEEETFQNIKDSMPQRDDPDVKAILSRSGGLPQVIVALARYLAEQNMSNMDSREREWQRQRLTANFMQELQTSQEFYCLRGLFAWMRAYFCSSPPSLMRSMLYLLIFPQGKTFRRRRLVRRWIAEGYAEGSESNSLEEMGKLFHRLASQSVIQETPADAACYEVNGFFHEYMISRPMEDGILSPLEVSVLDGYCCRLATKGVGQHLAVWSSWDRNNTVFDSLDFFRLRSLTVFGRWEPFFVSDKMRVLRVLDLEDASNVINADVDNIGRMLLRLKFLSLRGCKDITCLPDSFGGLRHLQTLDIRGTSIVTLSPSITKLHKLQYVRAGTPVPITNASAVDIQRPEEGASPSPPATPVSRSFRLPESWRRCFQCLAADGSRNNGGVVVPGGIGKMVTLHTLGVIDVSVRWRPVLEALKKLTQLRKLGVSGINRRNCRELCSAISGLAHLESVSVQLDQENSQGCLDAISKFPENLQSLKLYGYARADADHELPEWISRLRKLSKLNLQTAMLPSDGGRIRFGSGFDSLMVLQIACHQRLRAVTFQSGAMPRLECLKLRCCNVSSLLLSGLKELASLQEVWLTGSYKQEFKENLQSQINEHHSKIKPVLKEEDES